MSSGKRAFLLSLPLVAFAIGGGFYGPPAQMVPELVDNGSEVSLREMPALPTWASEPLPDFSKYRDTTERKAAFFAFLYPRVVLANSRVLLERNYLLRLKAKDHLGPREKRWLQAQADRLRVDGDTGSDAQFALLEKRLDVVPPSLVLAQAANESAWGTSRFARKGNNLFGQWCFSQGCGLVPRSRVQGATHEVATFQSPYRSIRSYIQNINRHATYQELRERRSADRQAGQPLSGLELAQGLDGYSERGQEYVEDIRGMIHYNNLEFYDDDFRKVLKDRSPSTLKQLASRRSDQDLLPGRDPIRDNASEG